VWCAVVTIGVTEVEGLIMRPPQIRMSKQVQQSNPSLRDAGVGKIGRKKYVEALEKV